MRGSKLGHGMGFNALDSRSRACGVENKASLLQYAEQQTAYRYFAQGCQNAIFDSSEYHSICG